MRSIHFPKIHSLEHAGYLLSPNAVCLVFEPLLILLADSPPVDVVAVVLTKGEDSPSQSVTLDLTISLAADSSSLTVKADNPSILVPTEVDNRPAEEATVARPEAQLTMESSRATVASTSKPLLPLTDSILVDSGALSPTAEISSAEKVLRDASVIVKTMNLHDTWYNAFAKIEWVMNVVRPITEVRLFIVANFNQPDFCLAAPSVREDGMGLAFNDSPGEFNFIVAAGMRSSFAHLDARPS